MPKGGGDGVNPAWRRALVHAGSYPLTSPIPRKPPSYEETLVNGATWAPFDNAEKFQATPYLADTMVQYLRDLGPHSRVCQ